MNCTVCHTELPAGARACPNCGTMVSSYGNTSYNDGTVVSSRNQGPQPPQPGTVYGSDPYRTSSQYNPPPPYNNPIPQGGYSSSPNNVPMYDQRQQRPAYTPPPYQLMPSTSPRPPRSKKIWLIVGIGLLIVVLLVGGSIFIISNLTNLNNNQAHQNATSTALAQPVDSSNPYPPRTGKLVLNDPMSNNSQGNKWDEIVMGDVGSPGCGFKSGGYHITSGTKQGITCNPEARNLYFSNLAFEVKLTVVSGESAGIFIRINQITTSGYLFTIDINGNYHLYNLKGKSSNSNPNEQELGNGGTSGEINKGLNASNLLAVVANGNSISVYANGAFLESTQDSTYSNGQIGIYGESQGALDVVAADARAWQL